MKRPAFQFYPADWRTDAALQSCSITARGVWHELLCVMHECAPYGHLSINGGPMDEPAIARLIGVQSKALRAALLELEHVAVFSRLADGTIFSRRMVKDEHLRNARAAGGQLGAEYGELGAKDGYKGGRPAHVDGGFETPLPTNESVDQQPPINPPPSSSSASSSLKAVQHHPRSKGNGHDSPTRGTRMDPAAFCPDEWRDWAIEAYKLTPQQAVSQFVQFRDYWADIPGHKGLKIRWLGTFKNRLRYLASEGKL